MKLSLIALASLMLVSSTALAKEKAKSPKVHLCEATDLYFGSVDSNTASMRLSNVCKDVSPKTALSKVQACAAETPETCEVIVSQDGKTLTIEHKVTSK